MAVICDPLLDPSNIALPRCMRTTPLKETNLSSEFSTFKPSKFGRFTEADAERLSTSLTPFRLFHSQSSSFVSASCDREKVCKATSGAGGGGGGGGGGSDSSPVKRSWRGKHLPAHVPYLKTLVGSSDPTSPDHQTAKGLWVVERQHRSEAGTVPWDTPVRGGWENQRLTACTAFLFFLLPFLLLLLLLAAPKRYSIMHACLPA